MVKICLNCFNKMGNTKFKKRHVRQKAGMCDCCKQNKKHLDFIKPKAIKAMARRAIKKEDAFL